MSNLTPHSLPSLLLQRKLLRGKAEIIEARVPIIKCRLDVGERLPACPTDWLPAWLT